MKPIEALSELEFAQFFKAVREKILEDPLKNFVKAPKLINFQPSPGQNVVLKNVFGQPLDALTKYPVNIETVDGKGDFALDIGYMTEIELYELFTNGLKYDFSGKKYNRVNLLCGRRAGKSTLASILALYSSVKVNWKPFLTKTPVATIAILSHSVDFSQEILDILKNMVEDSPVLTRLIDTQKKNTQSTFHLKIPFLKDDESIEYSRVAIKVGAASKKTTRGKAVCTLLADEACWWALNEDAAESDVEIFRAIRPALMQFGEHGTIIKLSSPAIKQGVMYEEWMRRAELTDFIQLKAPSWMMNSILPQEEFVKEFKLDPDAFNTEIRANFVDSISNFISPEFVDMCVVKGVTFQLPSDDKKTQYKAAIDAAFKGDRFAFAVTGYNESRVTTYVVKYWEGSKKSPVQASEVAQYIRTVCKEYGINEVVADQYSFQPLRELFSLFGVALVENTFTITYKRKIYFALKRLIHSNQIDLLDIPLLAKEIKELKVEQTQTGMIRIGHPTGGTDDLSDALAVAAYHSLEAAGAVKIENGQIILSNDYGVRVDHVGRTFSAPPVELLHNYAGFAGVSDNSTEWVKHPDTGKLVHISTLETDDFNTESGASFLF